MTNEETRQYLVDLGRDFPDADRVTLGDMETKIIVLASRRADQSQLKATQQLLIEIYRLPLEAASQTQMRKNARALLQIVRRLA